MFTFAASEEKLQDVKGGRLGYCSNSNQGTVVVVVVEAMLSGKTENRF